MIVAEIGLNHLGKEKLLKKYIAYLNKLKVDAVTVQILKKDFFLHNKALHLYIEKEKIFKLIFKFCKKKIGLIIDEVDENILQNSYRISFFKILGDQVKDKSFIKSICSLSKPIYISNKNTNTTEKKFLNDISKKNRLITLIHTQNNNRTSFKYSNLDNINKILQITKKKPAFGLHCNDLDAIKYACMFKPKDLFFYIKDNKTNSKYPDNHHAIKLKNINNEITKIKYLEKSMKFWK